jgi:hypothetical protein
MEQSFDVLRNRPHGHVAAVLGSLRRVGLGGIIGSKGCREHALSVAMIVARLIDPQSKLATARGLGSEAMFSTLSEMLGVESANEDELYAAMDWLGDRQEYIHIEVKLTRHMHNGSLVLYDVTCSYFKGQTYPLAKLGHNWDGKKGKLQIVFELLCTAEGYPVAVHVFSGDTGDPSTLHKEIGKMRQRLGLERVIIVGDRGLIAEARIREELRQVESIEWITALRKAKIRKLVDGSPFNSLCLVNRILGKSDPAYPGERLVVCRNPVLAEERARKREDLH